jgi:colanic acid biosynthesis glycosyl transferase WcaI
MPPAEPRGRLRAVFLTQWFDPEPGAVRGLPLARWLVGHGHEVKVLTGFPNYPGGRLYPGYRIRLYQREVMDGVPVLRVPLYPSHDASALRRVANYGSFALAAATLGTALIGPGDVCYVYHPPATIGLPAAVLKALRGLPFIYHISDIWPESVVESGMVGSGLPRRLIERTLSVWCRLVYRQAAAITVLSPALKRLLVERGAPGDRIHVIYNWIDEAVFRPVPRDENLARKLGLDTRFNVVYAGNLGPVQGLETAIQAAALLRDLPRVQFVLVGTGQREGELRALAHELRLDNVRFIERRQFWEMPSIYSLADVLLVSLRDLPGIRATIPIKTQVSLACGRPILMAASGDAADIVQKSGAGITCTPEDPLALAEAVVKLSELDEADLDAMGARGRAFYLDEMSLQVGAARTEALLQDVAGART